MPQPLLVMNVVGDQATMGRQHGELLREHGGWEATAAYYPGMPQRILTAGRPRVERLGVRALKPLFELGLRQMSADRAAEDRARSEAFSVALGLPKSDAKLFAVMDVFQNAVGMLAKGGLLGPARRLAQAMPPACSTLMAWGDRTTDGQLLHGRNFDFPGIGVWEQAPAVVFCTPTHGLRYGFATTRGADTPGVTCFNEAGITLVAHTRFHRDIGRGMGIVDLGHAIIREARTLDEAAEIARRRPIASSWGIAISSAEERSAMVLETTQRDVRRVRPTDGDWLACTNHYLSPALQVDEIALSPAFLHHCFGRLAVLNGRARAGEIDALEMARLLGSHLDPETGDERGAGGILAQAMTVQSIVSAPDEQAIWISVDEVPTGRGQFTKVPWTWSDTPGAHTVGPEPAHAHPATYARGARGTAWSAYAEASRLMSQGATSAQVQPHLDQAVEADPSDPSWRFLAGVNRLALNQPAEALAHLERGLQTEEAPFYKGQLLLWASRAAQAAGQSDRAATLRAALLELDHPLLAEHRTHALREGRRPPRTGAWKDVPIHLDLLTAG